MIFPIIFPLILFLNFDNFVVVVVVVVIHSFFISSFSFLFSVCSLLKPS